MAKELRNVQSQRLSRILELKWEDIRKAHPESNGEFDPGSGRTLAACLTHASRTGVSKKLAFRYFSGGRVSNA